MTERIWARVDVGMLRDPKVRGLSPESKVIFLAAILHSREHLTDGHVTGRELRQMVADHLPQPMTNVSRAHHRLIRRVSFELLESGLFVTLNDTPLEYLIPAYGQWQETRATVEKRREDARQRAARYRRRNPHPRSLNGHGGLFGMPP